MVASPLQVVVEKIFTFPPVFKAASNAARKKIMDRGREMGVWDEAMTASAEVDWDTLVSACRRPVVETPAYYEAPFHAYEKGNLSIEAALEVTNAAKSVHATVFNEPGQVETLDPNGDERLRQVCGEPRPLTRLFVRLPLSLVLCARSSELPPMQQEEPGGLWCRG